MFPFHFRSGVLFATLCLCFAREIAAQTETLYMSVLSSRKHRLNVSDNPFVGVFVSTDAGNTWEHRGWKEYIRTFYTEAGPDGVLWSACGNGVLRSTDGGKRWRITTGWDVTEVLKLDGDPSDPSTVYAATAYGIFKTTDAGETWQEKPLGLVLPFTSDVLVDRPDPSRVFAASEEGIFLSEDGGKTWSPAGLEGKGVRVIVQDPTRPEFFWAGTEEDGVFLSSDRGTTWTQKNSGLKHWTVYAIAVHPSQSSIVYAGTHGGGVYKTSDGGRSWMSLSKGLAVLDVHSLLVMRTRPDVVFAGTLNGGLYRSTNGGNTWEFNSQDEGQVWGLSSR
jgi:photosystem II stability/assembly factor-like uncharacterized protein